MAGYDESFFVDGPEGLEFGEEEDRRSLSEQQVPMEGDDLGLAREFIKEKESFVPTTYMPTPNDVPTIGYGHTGFVDEGQSIDEGEADALLAKDMGVASEAIDQNVTADLTPDQKNALISLVMNVGTGAFKNSKALRALNEGDLETFKQEAFSADKGFTKQGDKQLPGLVTRRAEEQTMFEGGPGGYGSEFFKGGPSGIESGDERSQDEQPVPGQGDFSFGEDIVRPTAALVASPFLWIPSKIAEHGYVAGLKFEDWLKDTKLTPQEQAEVGKGVGEWVASLGGLLTPRTPSAESSVGMVADVVAPIEKLAQFTAKGIDPEKHPNLHNLVATGMELGMFSGIHTVGKGLKTIATKRAKMMKLEGKAKAEAAINIVKEQERLLKKVEKDVESGKMDKIISDYWEGLKAEQARKKYVADELELQRVQNISAAEAAKEFQDYHVRKRMEEAGELEPKSTGKVAQTAQERQAELEASRPVADMTVTERPVETVPEKPFESTAELIQEESVRPTKEFKVLEDGTVDLVSTEPVGSEFKVQPDGTVETVKQVKPQTVWQTMLKPLKSETGAIDLSVIKELKDKFGKAPKGSSLANRMLKSGLSPDDMNLSGLLPYLKGLGDKPVDWKDLKKAVDDSGFDVTKDVRTTKSNAITQYSVHSLIGGDKTTYKETLYRYQPPNELTANMPTNKRVYHEAHWGSSGDNVMAHDRRHDRVVEIPTRELPARQPRRNAEGVLQMKNIRELMEAKKKENKELADYQASMENKNVVYLEEAQSNWHKKGEKEGYGKAVPDAPFKKSWPKMIMRDVIEQAVREGKDGVAWSTGDIQANRWGNKPQTKRDAIYDKTLPKYVKNEFGAEVKKVNTQTNEYGAKEQVWYAPITEKMKKMFGEVKAGADIAIDTMMQPLMNEKGSIDISRINNKVQRWLKDSHVKDDQGNIRPMFHLAKDNAVIKAGFDPKLSREIGIHFGTEGQIKGMGLDTPSGVADIGIPVLLNIKNPLRLVDAGDFYARTVVEQLVKHPDIPSKTIDALREGYKRTYGDNVHPETDQHNSALIRNELQKLGYDGIVYKNVTETVPYDPNVHKFPEPKRSMYPPNELMQDSYIAFKPEQVKGVYDNVISKEPSLASRVLAPLKNERGAINISFNRKKFKEQVSPETRDRVRKISKMAEEAGMEVKDFLTKQGSSKADVDSFMKLYKLSKEERPMQAALEQPQKSKGDFEFFKARDGARQVNVGKDSNTKIVIDDVDAGIVRELPRKGKSLMSYVTTADYMFDNYPKLRPLLDQYREISKAIKVDQVAASKHLKQIEKEFPDIRKREDVGVAWHAMSETGRKAMASLGKVIKENPEYMELKKEIEPLFKDLHDRINEQRVKLGKRAIPEMPDYLSFYSKESLMYDFWKLVKGEKFEQERSNLVMDSAEKIMDRHSKFTKDSTAFNHLHRTGLQKGIKLDLDPLSIYARYLNESLRHVHISPLNAFVHELLNSKHLDPKTNKMLRPVAETNPELHSALKSWNNAIAGMPNLGPLPKNLEKVLNVGMRNMTVAQLFGQLRTVAVQPVALYNTAIKHGMVNTAKGVMDMVRGSKDVHIEKSSVLTTAEMEAGIADINNLIETTKLGKVKEKAIDFASMPMRKVDYFAREATWRTVYNELKPLVESGKMTEKEAIRKADSEVIRTQGSGDIGEVSPVQRNVLGKAATLWQTYSINQLNFFMKDVFGTMGAEGIGTKARAERIGRALVGGALINTLFEQGLGVQSPLPAPEQALIKGILEGDNWGDTALRTVLEAAEAFPGGGSAKYGSHPLGPVVDLAGKITGVLKEDGYDPQSVVSKALEGDKKALLIVTDIVGSMAGVPGTKQATKYIRARDRGESVPGALMGRYDKKRKKDKWK